MGGLLERYLRCFEGVDPSRPDDQSEKMQVLGDLGNCVGLLAVRRRIHVSYEVP